MATIIVKRDAGSRKFTEKGEILQRGKAGRLERMFDKQHRINAAFEKMVEKKVRWTAQLNLQPTAKKNNLSTSPTTTTTKVNLLAQTPCTQCRSAD
ncbi:hypothetical protein CH568_007095 [Haemophilus influenzae]